MSWRASRCQFNFQFIAAAIGGVALATMGLLPPATPFAQTADARKAEATALARQTLAARLPASIEQLRTVDVSPAQWHDSSLGCPERGMTYAAVLTSGYKVRLQVANQPDQTYVVHVAGSRAVVCGSQTDSKLSPAPLIAASLKAADAVRAALAARLGIESQKVRILSARPSRSDLPRCAAAPSKAIGAAFIVEAEAEGRTFRYYSDDSATMGCDDRQGQGGRGAVKDQP